MLDINALIDTYVNDKTMNLSTLATKFGVKPADVGAILRLNDVKVRRGNPGGLTPEARAASGAVRRNKAIHNNVAKLVATYGYDAIEDALAAVALEQQLEAELSQEPIQDAA